VDPEEEAAPTANPSTIESIAAPTNPRNPQLSNSQDALLERCQDPEEDAVPFEIPGDARNPSFVQDAVPFKIPGDARNPSIVNFAALLPNDNDGSISSKSSSFDSDSDSSNADADSDSDSNKSSSQARRR
jgi:hypothetical protein